MSAGNTSNSSLINQELLKHDRGCHCRPLRETERCQALQPRCHARPPSGRCSHGCRVCRCCRSFRARCAAAARATHPLPLEDEHPICEAGPPRQPHTFYQLPFSLDRRLEDLAAGLAIFRCSVREGREKARVAAPLANVDERSPMKGCELLHSHTVPTIPFLVPRMHCTT